MKLRLLTTFLIILTSTLIVNAQHRTCGSMDYLEQQILEDPNRGTQLEEIENFTQNWIKANGNASVEMIYTIPVVVHVVYKNANENVSAAQIQSQIDVLNEDFRRLNSDANNNWSQAADAEIEFCLANIDPNGNATNGITRTSTTVNVFNGDAVKYTNQGGKDAWPAGEYLNMWVCALNGFLGYAQFPGGNPATDGVVIDYRYFGTTGTATPPFNLGRTGTHEVGHWLNLYHIWGDGPCGQDDLVPDTPTSDAENYGCPNGHTSCGSVDMIENYMDYTDDACMNLFTQGQKVRMRALFAPGGDRASLLNSNGCGGGGGNPPTCDTPTGLATNNVNDTSVDASWNASNNANSYNIQIAVSGSGNWTTTTVSGNSHSFSGLTTCTSYDVRVQADCGNGDLSSYSVVATFTTTGCSGGCQDTELTLTIVLDDYPEETTWEVVANGNVLASGGPYTTAGATETAALCLADDCYDFIIYDSYGDGICCAWGNGSYELKEDATGNVVASGGQFGFQEITNFCLPGGGGGGGNCNYVSINENGFENGWGIWNDGGSDARRNINDWPYATTGDFCIRLRDNTNTSVMTTDNINLSSYDELTIDFAYYVRSFDNSNEDFWLQVSTNGGSTYTTVEEWNLGDEFNNNEFKTDQVIIPGPFSSNTKLRFRADASGNADWVYIDDVKISGCATGSNRDDLDVIFANDMVENNLENDHGLIGEVIDMKLFPNPTSDELTIAVSTSEFENAHLIIADYSGKIIKEIEMEGGEKQKTISVDGWTPGFYAIQLVSGKNKVTQKLVVIQ